MIRHFNSLIFDYLSFTEGLITLLSSTNREAPAFNRRSAIFIPPKYVAAQ